MRVVFSAIRLELKTSVYEINVTVMYTVPGCDVTTVQQHYKGSTSNLASSISDYLENGRVHASRMSRDDTPARRCVAVLATMAAKYITVLIPAGPLGRLRFGK